MGNEIRWQDFLTEQDLGQIAVSHGLSPEDTPILSQGLDFFTKFFREEQSRLNRLETVAASRTEAHLAARASFIRQMREVRKEFERGLVGDISDAERCKATVAAVGEAVSVLITRLGELRGEKHPDALTALCCLLRDYDLEEEELNFLLEVLLRIDHLVIEQRESVRSLAAIAGTNDPEQALRIAAEIIHERLEREIGEIRGRLLAGIADQKQPQLLLKILLKIGEETAASDPTGGFIAAYLRRPYSV